MLRLLFILLLAPIFVFGQNKEDNVPIWLTDSISYGQRCSIANKPPKYRVLLEKHVEERNIKILTQWLKDQSSVINAYAVEGFYILKNKGASIDLETASTIQRLKNDDRETTTCQGCFVQHKKLKYILRKFKF